MGAISKRFGDESDFALATELIFSMLAEEPDQQVVHRMVSFLGFKNSILFLTAFGGQKLKVPKLDEFTKNVRLARAAVEVVRKGSNVLDAARTYRCKVADIEKAAKILGANLKEKKRIRRRYLAASNKMFTVDSDLLNQIESSDDRFDEDDWADEDA